MKKLRKGLLLLLFASVTAVFCIAAAADGGAETTPWAPEAESGVTYAVFSDEAAYNNGENPVSTSTSASITSAQTCALGGRYLIIYAETLSYSGTGNIINSGSLVINCNGNTFSTGANTNLLLSNSNIGIEVTFKNGTLVCKQLQFRYFKNLSFENMTCNIYELGYAAGGNLTATNSTFNLSKNMYLSNANGYSSQTNFSFMGCRINFNGNAYKTDASAIASDSRYYENAPMVIIYGNATAKVNISFDGKCTISMPNQKTAAILTVINQTADATAQNVSVSYEEGINFDRHIIPDETYAIKPYGATVYEIHKGDGTVSLTDGDLCYAIKKSDGFYTISQTPSGDDIAYFVFANGSKVAVGTAASYTDGVEQAIITLTELNTIPEGSTVVFNMDIRTSGADTVIFREFNKFLTFDLNGNTLYSDHRWGTSNKEGENFTLKNGKVIVGVNNYFLITYMGAAGGTVNIEDVEIEHNNSANAVFHLYGGVINLKNTKITTTATAVVSFTEYAGACVLNTDGVTVDATNCFLNMRVNKNTNHTFIIKDTVVKTGTVFNFQNTNTDSVSTLDNYLNLDITGCKFNAPNSVIYPSAIAAKLTLNLSESYFSSAVAVTPPHVLNFAAGEKPMAVEDSTYSYAVTKPVAEMQMNLVLSSELLVKLYIPKNTNVVSIKLGDEVYTVAELEQTVTIFGEGEFYVLPLKALAPYDAVDLIPLDVAFTKGGIKHTATLSLCITDYLSALLETEYSAYLKRLVTATGEYLAAAYAKEGKTAEALDTLRSSATYQASLAGAVMAEGGVSDMQALKDSVVDYARLNLDSTPKIRFGLKSTFSGVVTISGCEYLVTNGIYAENSYIEIDMPAYDLYDTVFTIEAGGITGTYTLAAYVEAVLEEELDLHTENLVRAFYTYCAYADAYESRANKS